MEDTGAVLTTDMQSGGAADMQSSILTATNSGQEDNGAGNVLPDNAAEAAEGAAHNEAEAAALTNGDMVGAYIKSEFGAEAGKVKYLQNEHSLQIPATGADSIDQSTPFDGIRTAGKWLKEAANLKNYWQAVQRFGEEFAAYKWAYDEGKMGSFNAKEFAKEAGKAGLRSVGADMLRTSGNLMNMFGTNMAKGSAFTTTATAGAGMILPKAGEEIAKIGKTIRDYAEEVENFEFWAPSNEAANPDPSWAKLANIAGGGSSQVLAMGMTAKLLGSGTAYGLFAGGGAGEMFSEAYEQSGDVSKANALAAANAGVTFAVDKVFNPLPEMIEKNARATSKKIAEEIFGAPLREAGSEALQQMLAENLVRKIGIDDTQDLFEGLIESALGAFAGSSVLTGASGAYYAGKNFNEARRRAVLKGVKSEELDLYQKNMQLLLERNPEAFEKILRYNLQENLRALDTEARQAKTRRERNVRQEEIKGFQKVYDTMYERFQSVLGDESKARAAAGLFEAGAMSLYKRDNTMTPSRLAESMLPTLKKTAVTDFLAQALSENDVSFQIIGASAKKADHDKMALALDMEKQNIDPQGIWRVTGWTRGADGAMRSEISDAGARIKLWDNNGAEEAAIRYMQAERSHLENMRAYLAAGLDAGANGVYGDYYKAFVKYLDGKKGDEEGFDPLDTPDSAFEIIDPEAAIERENENLYLGALAASLNHAQGEGEQAQFWRTLKDKFLKDTDEYLHDGEERARYDALSHDEPAAAVKPQGSDYGFIYRDYNDSDSKIIMAMLDARRFEDFKRRFWNPKSGPNKLFFDLAAQKEAEYGGRADYTELMDRITREADARRDERAQAISEKGVMEYAQLFQDIDLEEAYRRYVAYTGDFSGEVIDRDYRGGGYEHAYRPLTNSERFLEQEQFGFLKEAEKKALLEHLDKAELLYRIDKHLARSAAYEKQASEARNRRAENEPENGAVMSESAMRRQARRKLKNGMEMKLGEILEHQELYDNYPDMPETTVRFTKLKDGESSHFYHDREKGYVLEFDADKLYYANLKEELIRGTGFIIQDIEGFDYVLTDSQRRNFMDRQLYLAKKETGDDAVAAMKAYVRKALPGTDPNLFVVRKDMPVTLAGLTESFAVGKEGVPEERVRYKEVDYDKLTAAVTAKYRHISSEEGRYLRDYMYANLQRLKSTDTMRVMAEARRSGGYRSAGLPWSGVTTQGAMEARAVSQRINLASDELREVPYFDNTNDLRGYAADSMDAYGEFEKRLKEDRRTYDETLEKLARGAYDRANRTIYLFENADAGTIIHETFHSFWDMMEQAANRNDSHGAAFHSVMNDLREEVLSNYRIRKGDRGYYVVDKLNDMVLEELPISFQTSSAALDAAVRELFVLRFMTMFNGQMKTTAGSSIAEAADFYRRWLDTLALKLEINPEKAGKDGKKVLKFIKKKIQ